VASRLAMVGQKEQCAVFNETWAVCPQRALDGGRSVREPLDTAALVGDRSPPCGQPRGIVPIARQKTREWAPVLDLPLDLDLSGQDAIHLLLHGDDQIFLVVGFAHGCAISRPILAVSDRGRDLGFGDRNAKGNGLVSRSC
jgi:hypothetical protein